MTDIQGQLDDLSTQLLQVRSELGAIPDFARDGYLDNPIHTRMHEIGVAIDAAISKVDSFDARLAALESAPAPATSADTVAQLAALNIHVAPNVLAVGMVPDPDSAAGLQVGGDADAEVLGVSNTRGTDKQNPGEVHKNVLSVVGNDGGFRMIQYGHWGPRGLVRNTLNRAMTIFAIDSMGDICVSDSRVPYGQVWYLIKDVASQVVKHCAFQVGWKLEQRQSSVYGAADIPAPPQ